MALNSYNQNVASFQSNFFAVWCIHSILDTVAGSFPQRIQKIVQLENVWVGMQYFGARDRASR